MARAKRRNRKGSGQVVHAGRSWGIRYTEQGTRHYVGGYLTKDQAAQALANITAQIAAGLPGVPKRPDGPAPFIKDLTESWFESRAAMRNVKDDQSRYRRDLEPLVGHRRVDTVDTALIDELATDLKKNLDPASVERSIYLLSSFYRWAIRRKHVRHNPVHDYLAGLDRAERRQLRSQHDPRDTPYVKTKADVARIYRALPAPVNIAYALSALAGLRPGEVLALRWPDVDLDAARLTIRRRVRHGAEVDTTKNGKPRIVSMAPGLVEVLRTWKENATSERVVPGLKKGKHLGAVTIQKALAAALKDVGLKKLTFYQAGRHTFASQWVLAGQDIYQLSEVLGHAAVTTTQRYAHLTERTPASVLAAIDIKLAG